MISVNISMFVHIFFVASKYAVFITDPFKKIFPKYQLFHNLPRAIDEIK
jgi:amino acid permease